MRVLPHWCRLVTTIYPASTARACWAVEAYHTVPLQHLRPGILRLEDLLIGAYEGWHWPPVNAPTREAGVWLGAVTGLLGPELGATGARIMDALPWTARPGFPGPPLWPLRAPANLCLWVVAQAVLDGADGLLAALLPEWPLLRPP